MTYSLVRPERPPSWLPWLDLESFAAVTGLHPDLVRRLIALGLIDATPDPAPGADGRPLIPASQITVAGRIMRLRAAFSVNYAGMGLVLDLLDRVSQLEAALRTRTRTTGG